MILELKNAYIVFTLFCTTPALIVFCKLNSGGNLVTRNW